MRFIHTGDLHLGKRVHEQSMLDEQREALAFITDTAKRESADALVIAGDVYDRSVPPVEAVELFDDFITELESAGIAVVAVPGNHDSAERVGYGGRILGKHGVYVSGEYDGTLARARIGCADFWLLPFVRPAVVAKATGKTCADFDECVRAALSGAEFSPGRRNVLVAHQFVTAAGVSPLRSDSETVSVGGVDNVDVSAFDAFDYVALGHIHGPQSVGRGTVRYAGSPLYYSFSECPQTKSIALVELNETGDPEVRLIPMKLGRRLHEIRCTLADMKKAAAERGIPADSYMHVTLTDEDEIINAIDKVREVFPNTLLLDFDNARRNYSGGTSPASVNEKSAEELFSDFYEMQCGAPLSAEQTALLREVTEVGE